MYFWPRPSAFAAASALPANAEEHGFLEDASANLNLLNVFLNRNYTIPTKAQGGAQEWTQSFILDAWPAGG
ncbi:outer membrane porin [Pseudomonas synxantha BG33R]|nr:outer membrane porin [Pseudomonas synxantha BG33R]